MINENANKVKSGKEILNDFFSSIQSIQNVDKKIAQELSQLYHDDRFTEKNVSQCLQKLRSEVDNEN